VTAVVLPVVVAVALPWWISIMTHQPRPYACLGGWGTGMKCLPMSSSDTLVLPPTSLCFCERYQ
jgi:hypothetical protein